MKYNCRNILKNKNNTKVKYQQKIEIINVEFFSKNGCCRFLGFLQNILLIASSLLLQNLSDQKFFLVSRLGKARILQLIQFAAGYMQSVNAAITPQGFIAVISQSVEKCMHH